MSEHHFEHLLKCRCHHSVLKNSRESAAETSRFFISEAKPHFAPDRFVDVEHIKLDLTVDLHGKTLKGTCTQTVRAIANAVGKITFDAIDLVVENVADENGENLRFERDTKKLTVYLGQGISTDQRATVVIHYHVTEPRAGLYFIAPDSDYPTRPLQLWTQGQDQDNRYWIPCHDSPNEKASTEMIITVDERFTAISNGKLIDSKHNTEEKKKTFHWKQSIPHASYLITLCVGEFSEIKDKWQDSKGNQIPVRYWTIPGRETETKVAFGKTPKMIDFYSKKFGVDYPYEKYDQVVAWDFIYGGMENTSSTTQTEYTLHPESIELDYSSEPLVAHELAHQWFGDLLTCKDWSHAWLNEGFATYCECLWTEEEHGDEEFLFELYTNELIYKAEDSGDYRRPIVTNIFLSPSDIFDRHLYEKGGRVLHMLRRLVGDDMWWKAIHKYLTENYAKTVETIDLQRSFEETTGRSLAWFFDQWVFKAGHPDLKASYEWIEERKLAKITLNQKQKTGPLVALFKLPLQIKFVTSDGEFLHDIEFSTTEQSFTFSCTEKPKIVSINPQNTVLCSLDFNPGTDLLIEQLKNDKDVMGRVFAAKTLAKTHSRAVIDTLGEQLEKEKFWGVQATIATSLGDIGSDRCQDYLVKIVEKIKHPKARKNAIRALGNFKNELSADVLIKILKSDSSPLCLYEAGIALGRTRIGGVYEKLTTLLGKRESWHDYSDRGILHGLSELKNDDRVLPLLWKYSRVGLSAFIRRDAIDAISKHALARPGLVVDGLNDLTRDPNFFVKISTIEALSSLGDSRGIPSLQRIASSAVEPRTKRSAILAVKAIREGQTALESAEKLTTELDRMKEKYQELLSRIEKLEKT